MLFLSMDLHANNSTPYAENHEYARYMGALFTTRYTQIFKNKILKS